MANPDDAKSISSGITIPQWIKRIENRFDIDGTQFSPPAHDESFFYIRYPVTEKKSSKADVNTLNEALQNVTIKTSIDKPPSPPMIQNIGVISQNIDFSKHTEPCKKFIGDKIAPPVPVIKGQKKSQGTDDGFKGAGAACGSSILKVAQQVVSGKYINHSITEFDEAANVEPDSTLRDQEHYNRMAQSSRLTMRRGSKSLPTSPMGSPKAIRKISYNPYFTTYTTSSQQPSEHRGWFLSSLLGVQRETISSTSTGSVASQIEEEIDEIYENNNNNNINNNNFVGNKKNTVLKAKPSELREMNFWSPTSM